MGRIEFTVNGQKYYVGDCHAVSSDVTLLDYLRERLELRGTKYLCREGGCGACIVLADPCSQNKLLTVNSCLVSITSCHNWSITTTEDVGNRLKGYNTVQKTLADHNGTQCGYCSPAWVMSMISLLQNKSKSDLTMLQIEKSFAGHICRCTGYRPIMEAFKQFGKDSPNSSQLMDIEELHKICKSNIPSTIPNLGGDWCIVSKEDITDRASSQITIELEDNKIWYKVYTLKGIFHILYNNRGKSYMLVAGNTGKGVYPIREYPDVLIDISSVHEIKDYVIDQNLVLGAGNTLSETIDIFEEVAKEDDFKYLLVLAHHLKLVANGPVRNIASLAGNLMLKHNHHEFQSDVFLLLETVGAFVTIQGFKDSIDQMTLLMFLDFDMNNKVITKIELPPLSDRHLLKTFKIMPRAQNAIARVNAGFMYKLHKDNKTIESATIVFGNINKNFVHATHTEDYLIGKAIFTNETLQGSLKHLNDELITKGNETVTVNAKKKIALGLFYKGLLSLCNRERLDRKYRSGTIELSELKIVSKGSQFFETNSSVYPVNEPIPKLEGLIQCAGEAPYTDDVSIIPHEVFASFVLTTVGTGKIENIDAKAALDLPGVIAFYSANDLPGKNSFTPVNLPFNVVQEEMFCNGSVKFHSQPVGIVVAETRTLAEKGAKLVKITYNDVQPPVLNLKDAIQDPDRVTLTKTIKSKTKGDNTFKVIKGSTSLSGQYHFHMETQICITKPVDDGIEVMSSTQSIDQIQVAIQQALNLDENSVNISVRRLGGGFGAKITRSNQIAIACALATVKLNRPCRMILPLTTNMKAIGKRPASLSEFEVGVNQVGEIQYLNYNLYVDDGYLVSLPFIDVGIPAIGNSYNTSRWDINDYDVVTDSAKTAAMRSPGIFYHIAMTEHILEQISYELSLDPIKVRQANLVEEQSMHQIINTLVKKSEYSKRKEEIKTFNEQNRWKKRGLRFVPLRWPVPTGAYFTVTLSVYHGDGTISLTHGGIEMGQGINTKAAQVCAYKLGLPLDKIKVKASNNLINPNNAPSGGSFTSEMICFGVIKCCEEISERLKPVKDSLDKTAPWEDIIATAYKNNIILFTSYTTTMKDQKQYNVYGAIVVEVTVDILTGEHKILRCDMIEDVGQSLSPSVDIGQIEGALVMGLGYWTTEELAFDKNTGELLTDRTWNYFVPQAQDIPLEFLVYFRRHSYNELGVLGSKATGEPATCVAVCIPFAIRDAIAASRCDSGLPHSEWFNIDGAYTVDKIVKAANVRLEEFKFYD